MRNEIPGILKEGLIVACKRKGKFKRHAKCISYVSRAYAGNSQKQHKDRINCVRTRDCNIPVILNGIVIIKRENK